MTESAKTSPTHRAQTNVRTDVAALGIATIIAGLGAYGFVAIGTRALGAEAFSPVSILWTIWTIAAAALVFPVQHWVIRTIEADQGEGNVRSGLPRLSSITVAVGLGLGLLSWFAGDRFFVDERLLFSFLAALVPVGAVTVGLLRGALAGRGRFVATASIIAGESMIRLIGAGVLAVVGATAGAFGIVLVAGFLVALLGVKALRFSTEGASGSKGSSIAFLSGFAGGNLMSQVILTGAPLVLAGTGGQQAEVTGLFSALALFRAPFMLTSGLAPRLTGTLTNLVVAGRHSDIDRARHLVLASAVVGSAIGAAIGLMVGPELVSAIFGGTIVVDSGVTALIGVGSACAVANLLLTLVLVAQGNTTALARAWGLAFVAMAATSLLTPLTPIEAATLGFVAGEVIALVAMYLFTRQRATSNDSVGSSL